MTLCFRCLAGQFPDVKVTARGPGFKIGAVPKPYVASRPTVLDHDETVQEHRTCPCGTTTVFYRIPGHEFSTPRRSRVIQ